MQHTARYFDAMFEGNDDPWQFRSRWYEARKRALTLACLPQPRYESGYEPGCANGELSAALASRCDRLLVSDGSVAAVELARVRTSGLDNVTVKQAWVPMEWPQESFDLVVISELGYFLDAAALDAMTTKVKASLRDKGTVVACHWRRHSHDCEFDGDEVHRRIGHRLDLPRLFHVMEADFRIDLWCADPRSVAQREGFV